MPALVAWGTLRCPRILAVALVGLASAPFRSSLAQGRTEPTVELAFEQQVRDRWMHGRQQPRFTPFTTSRKWLLVDSLRAGDRGERRLYLTMGRFAEGRDSAIVRFGVDGRVTRLEAAGRPASRIPTALGNDSARFARMRWFDRDRLTLPESRLWDVVPTFRATPIRPGARWTDTLAHQADHEGYRQTLRGVRVSVLVGDTTIAGRRLWVVQDSARVHYEERLLEEERTLDTLVTITRTGTGVVRGRHVYDPDLGLFRTRDDTTSLSGEAVLQYPSNYPGPRTFRTPARYERVRHWDLYDQVGYTARQAALRSSAERMRGGMVVAASTDVERRLSAGDGSARDSVTAEWRRSDDPDRRALLFNLLAQWVGRDPAFRARLDSMRIAAGDTAYLYAQLADKAYSAGPADTADVRRMLAFMRDPGLSFSFNQSRDWLYENLRQGLITWPPAVASDARRTCTPAACRLLADQWRLAREPRLREVGLIALLALEPARWADTVLARARAGSRFLNEAAMLARGVGATSRSASRAPLPGPNAPWQDWAEWMNGVDPRYAAAYAAAGMRQSRPEPRVRFEESHATAIRFFQARTGRDVVGELRLGFESAPSDSARLVFGAMLQGLGELRLTAEEVAAHFRSGNAARIRLASHALMELFGGPTQPADSATALSVLDRLVALSVEGTPAWRSLDGSPAGWARSGPELHSAPRRGVYALLEDSTPPALRERWKGRVSIVSAAEWSRRPQTDAGILYTLSSVRRVGPFVLVGITAAERMARREGDAPRMFAAGIRYYLLEQNGEWVVVGRDEWVT
jgi:hypothetical protein